MVVFKSSSINRLASARGIGVYPVWDTGSVNIASNTTLSSATTDTLQLCNIPFGCWISNWWLSIPAIGSQASLVFKLVDNLASVTTYMTNITTGQSGGIITMSNVDATSAANMGAMYGATSRTVGSTGMPVLVWASGTQLQLVVTTTSTASSGATAVNILYMVQFSAMYDGGV